MNNILKAYNICLLVFLTLIVFQNCTPTKQPDREESISETQKYYTAEDFSTVKKIDTHVHIRTDNPAFIQQAVQDNFRFVDIDVYKTVGPTVEEQRVRAVKHLKAFPSNVSYATTFSTKDFESDGWQERTIGFLRNSFEQGAIGVKVWKNIGMELKDRNNNFVMIDHPIFDPVFDFIAESNITLLSHQGEPRDCWLPLDSMIFHQSYYRSHPEYHMFLHPEYPSYEDQINARDNMIAKHPNMKVVSVHMGSLEWSVDELAKRLDRYPNMAVDMAARINDLQFQVKNDRQKVYDFFIKYQDRLLYGTDIIITEASDADPSNAMKNAHKRWMNDWIFFVTDDVISTSKFDVKGLKLPREVIDKIYRKNAEAWLPGMLR